MNEEFCSLMVNENWDHKSKFVTEVILFQMEENLSNENGFTEVSLSHMVALIDTRSN
jgi:hypothetical protein